MGTHDLDSITTPFRYEARPPQKIKFAPLGKDTAYTAEELMTIYEVCPALSFRRRWSQLYIVGEALGTLSAHYPRLSCLSYYL